MEEDQDFLEFAFDFYQRLFGEELAKEIMGANETDE